MPDGDINDPAHWRKRAEEARKMVEQIDVPRFALLLSGAGLRRMWRARDERPHAGQQQQLVDQLGHDVLPRSGSGKTTTGSRNFGSATGMRTALLFTAGW